MHQFASGQTAAVGLVGADGPPLSTETIGRAPSNFEAAPVPLKSFEAILAERKGSAPAPVEPEPEAGLAADVRRVVVRLLGGDELELGTYDERDGAVAVARELVSRFAEAEAAGEWPEVEGRFVRPSSVASIDVLVCD